MSSPIIILVRFLISAKQKNEVITQCPGCGDRHRHSPHGSYFRYAPDTDDNSTEKVKVERFKCQNPDCSILTFSILPFPCLRYKRLSLLTFGYLVELAEKTPLRALARQCVKGMSTMRRLIRAGRQIWSSFLQERKRQSWGPNPYRYPAKNWTDFTQALCHTTLPGPG